MANWVITLANHYLRRLWKRIKEELLKQGVIHADETVLQVFKKQEQMFTFACLAVPSNAEFSLIYNDCECSFCRVKYPAIPAVLLDEC